MTQFTLKYDQHECAVDLPENWEECSEKIRLAFAEFLSVAGEPRKKLINILEVAAGKKMKWLDLIPESCLNEAGKCLLWLNTAPRIGYSLCPWIGIFKGPKDNLSGMICDQLLYADTLSKGVSIAFDSKDEKQIEKAIRLLVASLYTPFGIPFSEKRIEFYAWCMKRVSYEKITQAYLSWRSQRDFLSDRYPLAHGGGDGQGKDHGPRGLIVAMAGDKFGEIAKVRKTEIHYIFTRIEQAQEAVKK